MPVTLTTHIDRTHAGPTSRRRSPSPLRSRLAVENRTNIQAGLDTSIGEIAMRYEQG